MDFFASLYFYMSWNPIYGLLLLGIIAATYFSAVMIEDFRMKEAKIERFIMIASVGICLIILGVFKYSDFFLHAFISCKKILTIQFFMI